MYRGYIETALMGAKYHEDQAFILAHPTNSQYYAVVFHLRAYFWELYSIWDYILQHANKQTLDENESDVKYKEGMTFLQQIEAKFPNYKFLVQLRKIYEDERFKRITYLRNYAHKWQLDPYQVDFQNKVTNVITLENLAGKGGELAPQINVDRNDLSFMKDCVNELSESGFFNHDRR